MNKPKFEIPIWAKLDKPVWIEGYDKSNIEVIEYFDAIITSINEATNELKVRTLINNEEKNITSNILMERNPLPSIVEDLADIPILNDAELLKHLEMRFRKNMIHSYCGPTLLIINPYKRIETEMSHETHEEILTHLKNKTLGKAKPHIWTISSIAFEFMMEQKQNQAICISGESGSGKTESTKRCLEFITQIKSSGKSVYKISIEDQILRCNPLLECLGNAKTQVNDNSSRFGKYTVLYIDKIKKNVRGASIQNYLLEKSRVTNLGKEERTYHIFYCMCRFMSSDLRSKYLLNNDGNQCRLELFKYLNKSSIFETPKINDEEFYEDVVNSLKFLEFRENEQEAFWKILITVLYIGNLEIDESSYIQGSKSCLIRKDINFEKVVKLLGVDREAFEKGLTYRMIKIQSETSWIPMTPEKVKTTIDTLARELYNRLFNWIIKRLNKTLFPKSFEETNYLTIGILDIFGFEIFKVNSLEQLFINFANERLQGLYIDYIFKNECKIFVDEGLGQYTSLIVYKDNKPVIDTLESARLPPGVFDLLDQMSNTNKTDKEFFMEVQRVHRTSHLISFPKIFATEKDYNFSVKHTARDVSYYVTEFVDKNTEELQTALTDALKTGNVDIQGIFNETLYLSPESAPEVILGGRRQTLSTKFRKSMDELIKQLALCNCHFVRCLKPNELKKSDFWNPLLVLQQIRYMGLLDSLKIRKNSFPFRYTYSSFFEIFQDLDTSPHGTKNYRQLVKDMANFEELSRVLLKSCGIDFTIKDLLFGKTKIFLNEKLKVDLEKALLLKQKQKKASLALLQTLYRSFLLKIKVKDEITRQANVITLSRDFLCSWGAKAESLKFRKFLFIVRKLQFRFKRVVQKRQNRLKQFNMSLIIKHLALYKFNVKVQYLYYFKNKVRMMSEMLEKKMKESKIRFCKSIIEKCVNLAWNKLTLQKENEVALTIQRCLRAHLLRLGKINDITIFNKKLLDSRANYAAKSIQKIVRGFLVRRRFLRLQLAANRIKGFIKTRFIRDYFVKLCAATRLIQRNVRKYLLRKSKIQANIDDFSSNNASILQSIRQLEYSILFSDNDHHTNLDNIEDYIKMSFYDHTKIPDFGVQNYKCFLPKNIKTDNQARLFILPVDINVHTDTTNVYHRTWAGEFVKLMRQIYSKNKRLIYIDIGETFTIAITDENEVFTWGLNDHSQCGFKIKKKTSIGLPMQENDGFFFSEKKTKNISNFIIRAISTGKDHSFLIDEGNNLFGWGKCDEKQFGADMIKPQGLFALNHIPVSVRGVITREQNNLILDGNGKTYFWSSKNNKNGFQVYKNENNKDQFLFNGNDKLNDKNIQNLTIIPILFTPSVKIVMIDLGTDFALLLTDLGYIYSFGTNEFGQLGLGHNQNVFTPELVKELKAKNEKIIEISAGHKHFIALSNSSNVYCCGYNKFGQLGTGNNTSFSTPRLIKSIDPKVDGSNALRVQAGVDFSVILFANKQIWIAGKSGRHRQNEQSNVFVRLNYESKV